MKRASVIVGYSGFGVNLLAAGLSIAIPAWLYEYELTRTYITAIAAILVACGSISPVFWGDLGARDVVLVLFGHTLTLIVLNAGIHYLYGVSGSGSDEFTRWTPIYFSTVTWTTLGYGDFSPLPELRMLAAIEAFCSLVFFGLMVGVMAHLLNKKIDGRS